MLLHILRLLISLLSLAAATPQVKLGDTTLVGRDVTLLRQDFFGGKSPPPVLPLTPDIPQESLMQNLRLEPCVYDIRFCRRVLGRPLLMLETMALHVSKPCVHHPLFNIMSSYTWVCSRTAPKGFSATYNQKTVSRSTCSVLLDYLTTLLCLFCSGRMCLFIFRCI